MTSIKGININWWKVFFIIFVAAYVLILLTKTDLGGIGGNDSIFLRTLQAGKPLLLYSPSFPYFDWIKMGRFTPMSGMEYNLAGLFSKSPSAFWYYFINAVQYVLFMVLCVKIISKFTSNKFLIYITPVFISLTTGIIYSWFQIMCPERNLVFYFTIFIFSYISYLEQPKLRYLILGVISANLVFYYKETAFIALGAFTFFRLLFSWKNSNGKINLVRETNPLKTSDKSLSSSNNESLQMKSLVSSNGTRIFDGIVLLSSVLYLIIYFFYVFLPYRVLTYAPKTVPFVALIKNILNFIFVAEPIMMLIILPLTGWRLYRIFIKREKPEVFYDSLLLGASIFIISYFVLNLYNFYYFAPVYIFAILPLFYFIPKIWNEKLIWKILALMTGFLLLFNSLPMSLHYLTYFKYIPINFNKTLDFLVNDIKTKSPNKRANIFLDGMDRCDSQADYFVFSEFLLYKGLTAEQFDLKSDQQKSPNCGLDIHLKIPMDNFTVFQKGPLPKISKGDYLIVSPDSSDDIRTNSNKAYLKSLNDEYNLVFKTESMFAFPRSNLKELGRYFLSIGSSPGQKFLSIDRTQSALAWPDYYVFIKK